VIGRRRTQRRRAAAWALWLDAIRIAEQTGGLEFRADPALARRVAQVCRAALADVFEAVWARQPAAAVVALREAASALDAWVDVQHRPRENDGRREPPSAAAHVLMAPSLAELTAASTQDGAVDLGEMDAAAEVPSQHRLLRLAGCLACGGSCELTLDELLELDDTDLRYALEGIALSRRLWAVGSDLRWLHAAQALHPAAGGSDDGR
jgi:hypothetical protein